MASQTLLVLMLLFVMAAAASAGEIQWGFYNQVKEMSVSPGESVQFNYQKGQHNLVRVSEANYGVCGTSETMAFYDAGNTVVAFPSTGTFWFICSMEDHCSTYGMKVAVIVS